MTDIERRLLVAVARCVLLKLLRRETTGYSELREAIVAFDEKLATDIYEAP